MPQRTPEAALAAAMTEKELTGFVVETAKVLGMLRWHAWTSIHSPRGFPDETLVGQTVLFRELKTAKGKLTPAQQEWLDRLTAAGQDADVWRPADWLSGRIISEMKAAAGRR